MKTFNFNPLYKNVFLVFVICILSACDKSIDISQEQALTPYSKSVDIEVAKIELRDMKRSVNVYGTVIPSPPSKINPDGGQAILTSPNSGLITKVYFSEGENVKRGDVIAVLDDTIAKAQVMSAKADLVYAEKTVNQNKKLFANHNNSQQQLNLDKKLFAQAKASLIAAKNILSNLQIKSPIDGIVSNVSVMEWSAPSLNSHYNNDS